MQITSVLNEVDYLVSQQKSTTQGLGRINIHNLSGNVIEFINKKIKFQNKFYGYPHLYTTRTKSMFRNQTPILIQPNHVHIYRGIYNNGIPFGEIIYFNNNSFMITEPISDVYIK